MIRLKPYYSPTNNAYEVWFGRKELKRIGILYNRPGTNMWVTSATNGLAGPIFHFRWRAILAVIAYSDGSDPLEGVPTYEDVMRRHNDSAAAWRKRYEDMYRETDALVSTLQEDIRAMNRSAAEIAAKSGRGAE